MVNELSFTSKVEKLNQKPKGSFMDMVDFIIKTSTVAHILYWAMFKL